MYVNFLLIIIMALVILLSESRGRERAREDREADEAAERLRNEE